MTKIMDNKLNMVTGGYLEETVFDNFYLYHYGYTKTEYDDFDFIFDWCNCSKEVDEGWAKAGITCVTKPLAPNQYFRKGKEITEDLALFMLRK